MRETDEENERETETAREREAEMESVRQRPFRSGRRKSDPRISAQVWDFTWLRHLEGRKAGPGHHFAKARNGRRFVPVRDTPLYHPA